MKREVETKFFTFSQNNSGGYFVSNDEYGVGSWMIIEAQNEDEAIAIRDRIGENVSGFHSYCPCCGERWSDYVYDINSEIPVIYGVPVEQYKGKLWDDEIAFVHYYDGQIKKYILKELV